MSWRLYSWPRARTATLALLLIAAGNLLSIAGGSFLAMSIARATAGLGLGIAAGLAAAILTNMPQSESRFGLYLIVTAAGAALVSWLSGMVLEAGGIRAMFALLAVLVLPALLMTTRLPPLVRSLGSVAAREKADAAARSSRRVRS